MRSIFTICSFFLLIACKTIQPIAPELTSEKLPENKQETSTISLPISVNLSPYLKDINKSLPYTFNGEEKNCEGISYDYFFKRSPINFIGKGSTINYNIDGKYSIGVSYCPKCSDFFSSNESCIAPRINFSCGKKGEPLRDIQIEYATNIKLNSNYALQSSTKLINVEPTSPCEVSAFKYDATKTVKDEISKALKKLETQIDKEIEKVELKNKVEKAWDLIAKPISLNNYGFLYPNPKEIGIGDITFDGNHLKTVINLSLQPEFSTSPKDVKSYRLPNASTIKTDEGFNLTVDISATYDSLTTILNREIKGKILNVKKRNIVIEHIEIMGSQAEKLSIKINFSGTKKGVLFLNGTPTLNNDTQELSFPDLTFDLKTKNALLKSAKWIFKSKIETLLREKSKINLKEQFDKLKKDLTKELNRDIDKNTKLKGKINTMFLKDIYPQKDALIIRVSTSGTVSIEL